MSELEDLKGPVRRDEAHERWLAMQSAYAEYRRASEASENSQELTRDSAFERYLEARMEFLERRFDESYRPEAATVARPPLEAGGLRTVSRLAGPKWLVPVMAVGILSVTAFSVVREQEHVRDLDSARYQLWASLSDTRKELQVLTKKLEVRESTNGSGVHEVKYMEEPSAPAPQVDARKPSGGTGWRRLPERITRTTSRSVATRSYFSLSRSSHFKRVGPIQVSLKSVDVRGNAVDISIVSESGKVDVQRLKLNQPVRIKGSYRGHPMELVADRITAYGLSGHLIELHG